jgi:hypothetical protein
MRKTSALPKSIANLYVEMYGESVMNERYGRKWSRLFNAEH